jgi:hypothetical protein
LRRRSTARLDIKALLKRFGTSWRGLGAQHILARAASSGIANGRFWHKADMTAHSLDVRFRE